MTRTTKTLKTVVYAVSVAAAFWLIETAAHVYVFKDGGFFDVLHDMESEERYHHAVMTALAFAMGWSIVIVRRLRDAERAISASEERFRGLVENTGDWVWEVDADARYTYSNPRVKDILGYAPDEVIGKTPFDFMPPEEARRVAAAFGPIAERREPVVCLENANMSKDGRLVVLETSGAPFYGASGVFSGYRGIDRDVTWRKEAEALIRNERDMARMYLDIAGAIIVMLDSEGRVAIVNRKGCEVLGVTESEMLGKDWFSRFIPEDARRETREVFDKIVAGSLDGVEYHENYVLTNTGERRLVAWNNALIRDERGAVAATLSAGMDITDKRRTEDALKDRIEELERFGKAMVGRELRLKELKERVVELEQRLKAGDLRGTAE